MLNQVLIGLVVLVAAASALHWRYSRVTDGVANPPSDGSLSGDHADRP